MLDVAAFRDALSTLGFSNPKEVLRVLIVPLALAAFGYWWPLWLARTKRDAFLRLIRREMDEMNPSEDLKKRSDLRCWELLQRRFVHERVFLEPSANRDFILSLEPDLAYHEVQMWTAIQKAQDATWEARTAGTEEAKKIERRVLEVQAKEWDHHLHRVCTVIVDKSGLYSNWWEAIELRHPKLLGPKRLPPVPSPLIFSVGKALRRILPSPTKR